jgi:hypothetical protein
MDGKFMTIEVRSSRDVFLPRPPIEYLVKNLITTSSVNIFFGKEASKKTYSLLTLAFCMVNGFDWLHFKTVKSPVLFVNEETGGAALLDRIEQVRKGLNCYKDNGNEINYTPLIGLKLDKKDDISEIESLVSKLGSKLIIFDALADIMSGDENSKKDVQPIMSSLRKIADTTNSAVILIHHTNKGGDIIRGSSAIGASADLIVKVTSSSNIVNYEITKNRNGEISGWSAKSNWQKDKNIFTLQSMLTTENISVREEYILTYLEKNGESLLSDMVEDRPEEFAESTIRKTARELAVKKKVYRTNEETGNSKAKYNLVKE